MVRIVSQWLIMIFPIYEYDHSNSNCSVTGGYVYRGTQYPNLQGHYIFADYCSGRIWTLYNSSGIWKSTNQGQFDPFEYSSFGDDVNGELYTAGLGSGKIYKIEDRGVVVDLVVDNSMICSDSCTQVTGLATGGTPPYNYEWSSGLPGEPGPHTVCPATTTTYSLKVTDDTGLMDSMSITITIGDGISPVADVASLPTVTGECNESVVAPLATDNCSGSITGTTSDPMDYSTQGTYTITWTYDDGNGNTSTQTQTVIVDDVTAPIADTESLPTATGECSVSVTAPTASNNCAAQITGTTTDPTNYTTQGTYAVNWIYNDGNGNSATQTQTIIVKDLTPPTADIESLPTITGECRVTVTAPTAADNCAGQITGTTTDPTDYTTQGTYAVNWTYNDSNGNSATQTQTVIVEDLTPPIADIESLPTVTGDCSVMITTPTTTDNCAGQIAGTTIDPVNYTAPGTYIINWIYDDGNGNLSTQTQIAIVTEIDTSITAEGATLTANNTGVTYQWIDCNNENALLSGETNQSYTATSNGNYAVILDSGICSDTSSCYDVVNVGIVGSAFESEISIFPNPTNGIVNLNLGASYGQVSMTITDLQGRLVIKRNFVNTQRVKFNLSDFYYGIYFVNIDADDKAATLRLIKN